MQDADDDFYERVDAHIKLSNSHIEPAGGRGKASASMMYATARFNAWLSACNWQSSEKLADAREETIEYFVAEYRKMLELNLNDYIQNFETYLKPSKDST
jgi:hypothetical protein